MSTLFEIASSILQETKDLQIPASFVGNNEPVAKQILEAIKTSLYEVSRSYDWQELQKEYSFTTTTDVQEYDLPTDFDRFINLTFWNSSNQMQVFGPLDAQKWRQIVNSTISGGASYNYFRIRANKIVLYPAVSGGENFIYEYITKNFVKNADGELQSDFTDDSDEPTIDSYIIKLDAIWRFLKNNGKPYAEEQRTANLAIAERVSKNGARPVISHNSFLPNVKVAYPKNIYPI